MFHFCFVIYPRAVQSWHPWKKTFLEGASRRNLQREKHPSQSQSGTICLMYVVCMFLINFSELFHCQNLSAALSSCYFYNKLQKGLPKIEVCWHPPSSRSLKDPWYLLHLEYDDWERSVKIIDQAVAFKLCTSILSQGAAGWAAWCYWMQAKLVFLLVECGADLLHHSFLFLRFSFINDQPQPKGDTLEDLHVDKEQLARWFSFFFFCPNQYFIHGSRVLPYCKVCFFIRFYFLTFCACNLL